MNREDCIWLYLTGIWGCRWGHRLLTVEGWNKMSRSMRVSTIWPDRKPSMRHASLIFDKFGSGPDPACGPEFGDPYRHLSLWLLLIYETRSSDSQNNLVTTGPGQTASSCSALTSQTRLYSGLCSKLKLSCCLFQTG